MFGLMVVGVGLLYLLLWIGVTAWAHRWAKRRGYSKGRTIGVAFAAFLLMYLIPFWDHIPTLVAHKYSCEKEAGFWVYKTLEQWKQENPGVMDGLVSNNGLVRKSVGDGQNYTDTSFLNSRFNWMVKKTGPFLFNRWRWEQEVVDGKNSEVLARYVDFSTGNGHIGGEPELRFWLHSNHCAGGDRNDSLMWKFTENFLGVKK